MYLYNTEYDCAEFFPIQYYDNKNNGEIVSAKPFTYVLPQRNYTKKVLNNYSISCVSNLKHVLVKKAKRQPLPEPLYPERDI